MWLRLSLNLQLDSGMCKRMCLLLQRVDVLGWGDVCVWGTLSMEKREGNRGRTVGEEQEGSGARCQCSHEASASKGSQWAKWFLIEKEATGWVPSSLIVCR